MAADPREGADRSVELTVGRIGRPHGVRGEVTVEVRTDDPDRRFAVDATLRTRPPELGPVRIEAARWHGERLLLRLAGVGDRDAAERLRGALLIIDADPGEPTDDPDEFFDHQLIGLSVHTVEGAYVGEIHEVVHLPAQELLALRRADGGELLVPFVGAIVTEVDVPGRRAVIAPPAGLLDGESATDQSATDQS